MAMRMRSKVWMFSIFYFCGLPLIVAVSHFGRSPDEGKSFLPLLGAWFVIFATLQFAVFRCPHCRKVAVIRPGGWVSPFVGSTCRYCHQAY
jgi:hypothetical protein